MIVLAFDRDWTVDVNPPPDRRAVPVEWVTYWSQETNHEVWAIGNQDLVYEAGIPGVVEAVRQYHGDLDVLGERDENGRYDWWPSRERRLELLAELHPDANGYIVVDDINLSHVDGWDHYTAWEFRDAIDTYPLNSYIPEPSPDSVSVDSTGSSTSSSHSDHVDAIREQLRTATKVELRVDGEEEPIRATSWTKPRPAALPIDAPPTRDFTTETGDTRRIHLPDVVDVTVLETDPEDPDTNSGPDIEFPDATIMSPRAEIVGSLSTAHRVAYTIDVLRNATQYSALPVKLMGEFRRAIDDAPPDTGSPAVQASKYAAQHPSHLQNHVDDLIELTGASDTEVARRATWCLMDLAEENPTPVVDAVPALTDTLETDDDKTREYATYALTCISNQYPEELLPALAALLEQVETENNTVRMNALAAIGHVVSNYPDAAVEHVDTIATLLDDDAKRVRNNAAGFLADIAQEHPGDVIEHADALANRLDDQNIQARINATIALLEAGHANPAAVRSQSTKLGAALEDASPEVRANACTLIANADAPVPNAKLRDLRANDPNETVRDRAAKAIQRLSNE